MPAVKEELFEYFEVSEKFDVSINCISEGVHVPPHTHDQDVYNYVFTGTAKFTMDGEVKNLEKGDWLYIEKHKVHELATHEDVQLLEFWKK